MNTVTRIIRDILRSYGYVANDTPYNSSESTERVNPIIDIWSPMLKGVREDSGFSTDTRELNLEVLSPRTDFMGGVSQLNGHSKRIRAIFRKEQRSMSDVVSDIKIVSHDIMVSGNATHAATMLMKFTVTSVENLNEIPSMEDANGPQE